MGPGYTTWVYPSAKEKVKKKKRGTVVYQKAVMIPFLYLQKRGLSPILRGHSRKEGNRLTEFGTLK